MNVGERLSECGMRLFRGATRAMGLALSLVVPGGLVTAGDEPPEPRPRASRRSCYSVNRESDR
jgi:hypothetical protein